MTTLSRVCTRARQALPFGLLLLLPSLLYWPAVWARYGFRDDYSSLREATEEPGKLFWFTSTMGRPVYGLLLENSFRMVDGIDDLPWARLAAAVCVGATGLLVAWGLRYRQGWPPVAAWLTGALLTLLPSAQIVVGWAICWPHVLAAALGTLAFAVSDWGLRRPSGVGRIGACVAGTAILVTAMLIYQPNGLCYVVLLAAGWLAPKGAETERARWMWLARHVFLVAVALVTAFFVTKIIFWVGIATAARRVVIELHWPSKLWWFLRAPLDNALGLFVLENQLGKSGGLTWHGGVAALVALALGLGGIGQGQAKGRAAAIRWFGGGAALMLLAYAVSLVAAERWPTYRTLYALSGVVVVYLAWTIARPDLPAESRRGRWGALALASLVVVGASHARWSITRAHAVPQSWELWHLEQEVARLDPVRQSRVLVVLPDPHDSWAELRYLDEFGSLSADSEWCAKEMIWQLLQERYPDQPELIQRLDLRFALKPAAPETYDVLIDLRVRH